MRRLAIGQLLWMVAPLVFITGITLGSASGSQVQDGDRKVIDLWLLGLFPFNGSWPGGLGQLPAIKMGLEDVNEDPVMLTGYKLHMTINDTAVSTSIFLFL